jgi:hypothetical protein
METSANRELYLDWNDNLAAIFEANMKPNWRTVGIASPTIKKSLTH